MTSPAWQAQKKEEALSMRAHKLRVASEHADMSKEQERMNRAKHNDVRLGKYVPPAQAIQVSEDPTFTDAIRYTNTHRFDAEGLKLETIEYKQTATARSNASASSAWIPPKRGQNPPKSPPRPQSPPPDLRPPDELEGSAASLEDLETPATE